MLVYKKDLGNEQQRSSPCVCVNKRERTKQKKRAGSPRVMRGSACG